MTDIFELNESIFGTTTKRCRASRRTRKAMAETLVIPDCAHEMSYDDCQEVNGGSFFNTTRTWYSGTAAIHELIKLGVLSGFSIASLCKAINALVEGTASVLTAFKLVKGGNSSSTYFEAFNDAMYCYGLLGAFYITKKTACWGALTISISASSYDTSKGVLKGVWV